MSFAAIVPELTAQVAGQVFSPSRISALASNVSTRYLNDEQRNQYFNNGEYYLRSYQNSLYQPIRQAEHYRGSSPMLPGQYFQSLVAPQAHQHLQTIHRSDGRTQVIQKAETPGVSRLVPLAIAAAGLLLVSGVVAAVLHIVGKR